jgi:hypothetical protein
MSQATMKKSPAMQLEAPRFEFSRALLIAGLRERYTSETMKNMPELWQRFAPHIGNMPGQVGRVAYGLCFNALSPDGMDYMAGVEVSGSSGLPSNSASRPSRRRSMLFSRTANMFPNSAKRWMRSTNGYRDQALKSLAEPPTRQTSSSATPKNSIRGPEWAVLRSGCQSKNDRRNRATCGANGSGL